MAFCGELRPAPAGIVCGTGFARGGEHGRTRVAYKKRLIEKFEFASEFTCCRGAVSFLNAQRGDVRARNAGCQIPMNDLNFVGDAGNIFRICFTTNEMLGWNFYDLYWK